MFKARVVLPRRLLLDPARLSRAIDNTLDGQSVAALADFEVTQETWSDKSKANFKIERRAGARDVSTTDTPYVWVNNGTKPHAIQPKAATRLAFPANYAAKTTPRVIASQPGGGFGPTTFARQVQHPGTEAREFDKTIAKKYRKLLPIAMQRAIDAEVSR